ncbi:uncharacterized protein LOC121736224 [Aricia agestis]|uniref:uncharacterized protein LOC121736224 n=1 Tax=Aricia agestis TaxID=91739 RepID=UPI001C206A22|nr:uncharacterized protein LOC121736224 [Aricia agestis]
MPLTPAEKMKRYREKLKKDPDRYEEYKKRDKKYWKKLRIHRITNINQSRILNMERNLKEQIVKSASAVKRKVEMIKIIHSKVYCDPTAKTNT